MGKLIDLTGRKFSRLFVIEKAGYIYGKRLAWLCQCECGKSKVVYGASLTQGKTRSCGCLKDEISGDRIGSASRTHGEGCNKTPEYISWAAMRQRCLNKNNPAYKYYGGRGIVICSRWGKYENFLIDMGRKPNEEYSIERKDNNKGYSHDNCKWATKEEQANNRRSNKLISHKGKTLTLARWAKDNNMTISQLWRRLDNGWSMEGAISKPIRLIGINIRRFEEGRL